MAWTLPARLVCRASRAIRVTSGIPRFRRVGCTARWAIRRRSSSATISTSSCTTISRSIAAGIASSLVRYYFHLQLRPEQPDNARGAFTYTGQFTGNAFADFLLGYPTSAVSGIGRGDEDGRTSWLHLYAQDDWQWRDNLTFNLGLRYEYNQHMYDVDNRLSSIDLATPGGRFVIASDENGEIHPDAQALLPLIPIPYVTSEEAGWGRGLLDPSAVRLAPRLGFALSLNDSRTVVRGGYGIFLNQWAYSVQTAFARNLPFFFTKQVDVPVDVRVPTLRTADMLTSNATGTIGASTMDFQYNVEYSQSWSGGLQHELSPATAVELSYLGTWTLGADNATIHNVPEPGSGPIQPRRPIPQLSRINAIRFDGKSIYHGVTFKAERRLRDNYAFNVSYTLSTSKDDASSPGPTESEANVPQNVRNIFSDTGEWAYSSFDHRHLFVASGIYQLPFFASSSGLTQALFGGWRANVVLIAQSGAPFTVNLGVDQANIGAGPAQRPDQLRNPNLPGGERTPERWFDTAAFALPALFTFGTAPRNSVIGPGFANVDFALAKTWGLRRGRRVGVPLGGLQPVQSRELRSSEPNLRDTQLRPHLQREKSAGNAVRRSPGVLTSSRSRLKESCNGEAMAGRGSSCQLFVYLRPLVRNRQPRWPDSLEAGPS